MEIQLDQKKKNNTETTVNLLTDVELVEQIEESQKMLKSINEMESTNVRKAELLKEANIFANLLARSQAKRGLKMAKPPKVISNLNQKQSNQTQQQQQLQQNQQLNQMSTNKEYSFSNLAILLKSIKQIRGANVMPDVPGQYVTNDLGIRELTPAYKQQLMTKRNNKANQGVYAVMPEYFNLVPAAQTSGEAQSQLSRFNNVRSNQFGQWLVNGQLTSFKKITAGMTDVQKRSPIILLMKRMVQLQRAKVMVQSYINKNKSIQKSEDKLADPDYVLMRRFNQLKNSYKKMQNDTRLQTDPSYKLKEQINKIETSRKNILDMDTLKLGKTLKVAYDKQKIVSKLYQQLGQTLKKKNKSSPDPQGDDSTMFQEE